MTDRIPLIDEPFIELIPGLDYRRPGQWDPTEPKPIGDAADGVQYANLQKLGRLAGTNPFGQLAAQNLAVQQQGGQGRFGGRGFPFP